MACRSHDSGRSAPEFDLCAADHEPRVVPLPLKVATFQPSFLLEGPPKITDRVALPLVDDAVARGRRGAGALFDVLDLETGRVRSKPGWLVTNSGGRTAFATCGAVAITPAAPASERRVTRNACVSWASRSKRAPTRRRAMLSSGDCCGARLVMNAQHKQLALFCSCK